MASAGQDAGCVPLPEVAGYKLPKQKTPKGGS